MLVRTRNLGLAALLCVPALARAEEPQSAQERQARPRSSSDSSDRQRGSSASSDRRGGSQSSSAAQRHARPRSSASGASSARGVSGRHTPARSGAATAPAVSGAQSRQPRPGTGTGYRVPGFRSGRSYGYDPYYGSGYGYGYRPWSRHSGYGYYSSDYPWYGPGYGVSLGLGSAYYYGYYPYYGGGGYAYYPAAAPVAYVSYRDPDAGAVRVQVEPRKTRVYVDGHYAGVADDFDGLLQRLALSPGRHELTLELEGYRSHRLLIYVNPGTTLKLRHDMQRGDGAATLEDLTGGLGEDEDEAPSFSRAPGGERDAHDEAYARYEPSEEAREAREARAPQPGSGVLRVRVSPADASLYVDGAFRGTGQTAGELVLSAGAHRIEVVRPGYDPWLKEIDVLSGERRDLNVQLPPR